MTAWHVPEDVIRSYAAAPREVNGVVAASIEQHLVVCRTCQDAMAAATSSSELDAIWSEVADRVDRADPAPIERLLRWMGLHSGPARLIAATPALRLGALGAVAVIVGTVVLVSRAADLGVAFLVMAPVVPTGLVAMSFAPATDPAGECGLATPAYGFGLLMRRAAVVEGVAVVVLAIGSAFVPIDGVRALAWVAPSIALSLATLAGAVRWPAPTAATVALGGWVAVIVLAYAVEPGADLLESAVFGITGQVVAAWVAALAAVVVMAHREVLLQEVSR